MSYQTLDSDRATNPTFLGAIDLRDCCLPKETFKTVTALSVLEHTKNPSQAINNLAEALLPGGTASFLTPWDLRFHGPRPDCWRISDDGYRALLDGKLQVKGIRFCDNPARPLSPFATYVHAEKS